ncbi:MAG: hypothetical protein IH899_01450 [Planctomycetes bacterium]|nr:hypothetical protein [Planctomycetota bacterium]
MNEMLAVPKDTTQAAARIYFETLRNLGPQKRLEMGAELSNSLRERVEAGIRRRHPDYSEQQVRRAFLRLTIGDELFQKCFPNDDVMP